MILHGRVCVCIWVTKFDTFVPHLRAKYFPDIGQRCSMLMSSSSFVGATLEDDNELPAASGESVTQRDSGPAFSTIRT